MIVGIKTNSTLSKEVAKELLAEYLPSYEKIFNTIKDISYVNYLMRIHNENKIDVLLKFEVWYRKREDFTECINKLRNDLLQNNNVKIKAIEIYIDNNCYLCKVYLKNLNHLFLRNLVRKIKNFGDELIFYSSKHIFEIKLHKTKLFILCWKEKYQIEVSENRIELFYKNYYYPENYKFGMVFSLYLLHLPNMQELRYTYRMMKNSVVNEIKILINNENKVLDANYYIEEQETRIYEAKISNSVIKHYKIIEFITDLINNKEKIKEELVIGILTQNGYLRNLLGKIHKINRKMMKFVKLLNMLTEE